MTQPLVYLDNNASTPCDPTVVEAMLPFLMSECANPSSAHLPGRRAAAAVEQAREKIVKATAAIGFRVIFNSGATEGNNAAVFALSEWAAGRGRQDVAVSAVEHKSVLESAKEAVRRTGGALKLIAVDRAGRVDLGALTEGLDERTGLLCLQAVNNELGTIQPIAEAVELAHARGVTVHCDAAQSLGKLTVDLAAWNIDSATFSGHKCYGPKGVGAWVLHQRFGPRQLQPQLFGGGHEDGLRSGTINVPGVVGFGVAAELCSIRAASDDARTARLRDTVEKHLVGIRPDIRINGVLTSRVGTTSSLTIPGIEADTVIARLRGIALSAGSACNSGAPEPSHVLTAIGLSRSEAYRTIRLGWGRFNSDEDAQEFLAAMASLLEEADKAVA